MEKIGMQIVLPYGKHRSELPDDVKKLLAKYNVDYDGGGKLLAGDDYDHFLYVGSLEQAEGSWLRKNRNSANQGLKPADSRNGATAAKCFKRFVNFDLKELSQRN